MSAEALGWPLVWASALIAAVSEQDAAAASAASGGAEAVTESVGTVFLTSPASTCVKFFEMDGRCKWACCFVAALCEQAVCGH